MRAIPISSSPPPAVAGRARPGRAALLLGLALAGCGVFEQQQQPRGNHVDPIDLAQLVPGTSTKADVTTLLGSPTAHASFDDATWLYIGETTRPRIGQVQGIEDQKVVVATFDQGGTLRGLKTLDRKDAETVAMEDRTTPSPGSSASFMQQLLGNIGRYSPGGILGSGSGSQLAHGGSP